MMLSGFPVADVTVLAVACLVQQCIQVHSCGGHRAGMSVPEINGAY